jgi:RNA ligase (TIGR02306 family)
MSQWKVSKEKIEIFEHGNADTLSLGKVGSYQVVVQSGLYKDGDTVVFAPEKSVLTGKIKEEFEKYLVGPENDRVKGVRLRGEISSGILIPPHLLEGVEDAEIGEDISEKLGISHYEPPIPVQLAGKVKSFEMDHIGTHDCEQVGVYANELVDGERVVITEKVHGCCDEHTILVTEDGEKTIRDICDSKYTGNVLSYNIENESIEYDRIIGHGVKENVDNWYLVELEDGSSIKLTDNHRVYLPELNCYRSVSELMVSDVLLKR